MFGRARFPFALDIGSSAIKLVQFERTRKGLSLARLGMVSLAPGAFADGVLRDHEEVMRAVDELIAAERAKAKEVVVALSGSSTVVRTMCLPESRGLAREAAIEAEAEQLVPFPVGEARLSHRHLGRTEVEGQSMEEFLLVAVKRKVLAELVDLLRHLGLVPKIVDVDLLALESGLELAGTLNEVGDTAAVAIVDIGASGTHVHVLRGRRTVLTRTISSGGAAVTEALAKGLGVSREEAESIKVGTSLPPSPRAAADAIRAEVEGLARELGRTLQLLWQVSPQAPIQRLVLSGGGVHLEGLPAFLGASLDVPVEIARPFRHVQVPAGAFDQGFVEMVEPIAMVGAGLAYRALEEE